MSYTNTLRTVGGSLEVKEGGGVTLGGVAVHLLQTENERARGAH